MRARFCLPNNVFWGEVEESRTQVWLELGSYEKLGGPELVGSAVRLIAQPSAQNSNMSTLRVSHTHSADTTHSFLDITSESSSETLLTMLHWLAGQKVAEGSTGTVVVNATRCRCVALMIHPRSRCNWSH